MGSDVLFMKNLHGFIDLQACSDASGPELFLVDLKVQKSTSLLEGAQIRPSTQRVLNNWFLDKIHGEDGWQNGKRSSWLDMII